MSAILVTLHIIVCTALIMIVLLQTGKGSDMGAAFGGGGSQTLFGSTGASTFLSKATTVAAIVFMITCLSLAYISGHKGGSSIMPDKAPVEEKVPAAGTDADKASADIPADQKEVSATESTVEGGTEGKTEETAAAAPVQSSAETSATTEESAPLTSSEETSAPLPESAAETPVADTDKPETGEADKTN